MQIKIGDFGLAAQLDNKKQRRFSVCGTPNYLAPEILDSTKFNGHSVEVDIWSLGIIAYILLFGRPPFEDKDNMSTYTRIKANSYVFKDNVKVSEAAKDFIKFLLVSDPN